MLPGCGVWGLPFVILDPEDGYLSLYGRNARIFVQQNERVSVNWVLATVDTPSPNEQNSPYFEIRRHGSSIAPPLVCSNQRTQDESWRRLRLESDLLLVKGEPIRHTGQIQDRIMPKDFYGRMLLNRNRLDGVVR